MRCRVAQERAVNPKEFLQRVKAAQCLQGRDRLAVVAWLPMQIAHAFENYRARLNRLFHVESDDLYRAE
jgi:hypothetical protein